MHEEAIKAQITNGNARIWWKNHLASWKNYALAGGASLAAGTSADAQIVHTVVNQSLTGNNATSSFKFSINGHNVSAIEKYAPGPGPFFLSGGQGFLKATGIQFGRTANGPALNYANGSAINGTRGDANATAGLRAVFHEANGRWITDGNFGAVANATHRAATVQGYLGFQTQGANHDKGWIHVEVGPSTNGKAGVAFTVLDYAYNSSGGPINAGQTSSVPEPGTMALALMAAGAAGIASIRRARAKFAGEIAATEAVA